MTPNTAIISTCGKYRYLLTRHISPNPGTTTFIMLNPSTADEHHDDPTIRKCIGYTKLIGDGQLQVVNLFAIRSRHPRLITNHPDPTGPYNHHYIAQATQHATHVICAWGTHGGYRDQDLKVLQLIRELGVTPLTLGITKHGHPQHPLMTPYNQPLIPYHGRPQQPPAPATP